MISARSKYCIAFADSKQVAAGDLYEVAIASKKVQDSAGQNGAILLFDEESKLIEIDFRGSLEEFSARLKKHLAETIQDTHEAKSEQAPSSSGPGRPKLGVVAREVTLLPRQWEWLASQPGGASVTLRKLVESARKENSAKDQVRRSREITYKFMSAMAGNEPGFEEASRALFANDKQKFDKCRLTWPPDVSNHITWLAKDSFTDQSTK